MKREKEKSEWVSIDEIMRKYFWKFYITLREKKEKEKKEKKADLEQLLNNLIEKGRIPFGSWWLAPYIEIHGRDISFYKLCDDWMREWLFDTDIRAVLSIDSWLWQFVCENGMVDDWVEYEGYALVDVDGWAIAKHETWCRYLYSNITPEFYIMESALKDESELEEFLLNSIKID